MDNVITSPAAAPAAPSVPAAPPVPASSPVEPVPAAPQAQPGQAPDAPAAPATPPAPPTPEPPKLGELGLQGDLLAQVSNTPVGNLLTALAENPQHVELLQDPSLLNEALEARSILLRQQLNVTQNPAAFLETMLLETDGQPTALVQALPRVVEKLPAEARTALAASLVGDLQQLPAEVQARYKDQALRGAVEGMYEEFRRSKPALAIMQSQHAAYQRALATNDQELVEKLGSMQQQLVDTPYRKAEALAALARGMGLEVTPEQLMADSPVKFTWPAAADPAKPAEQPAPAAPASEASTAFQKAAAQTLTSIVDEYVAKQNPANEAMRVAMASAFYNQLRDSLNQDRRLVAGLGDEYQLAFLSNKPTERALKALEGYGRQAAAKLAKTFFTATPAQPQAGQGSPAAPTAAPVLGPEPKLADFRDSGAYYEAWAAWDVARKQALKTN